MRPYSRAFQSPLAAGFTAFLAHKRALRLFDRFLVAQGLPDGAAVTPALVAAFLGARSRRPRSVNVLLGVLRQCCGWLAARGLLPENPVRVPPRRPTAQRVPYLFDAPQAQRLLACAGALPDGPRAPRRGATYRTAFALLYARALLLFLYNTGARVQEVAELRVRDLELAPPPRVRLHGKGDKWRTCPLWPETARQLQALLAARPAPAAPDAPVFVARGGRALTRFGIYKLVRRHAGRPAPRRRISPHVFRHTTAVHLLEAGVEPNVIRGWLGHVSLETTHRYAELSLRAEEAALRLCEAPPDSSPAFPRRPVWHSDAALLAWLNAL
jgi:site-specific recombinase XerD